MIAARKDFRLKAIHRGILATSSLVALMTATAATAQDAPAAAGPAQDTIAPAPPSVAQAAPTTPVTATAQNSIADIVVTGSQIRGVAPIGVPVTVVNRAEIQQSGLVTTADILHALPQVSSLGAGAIYSGNNQNASLNTSRNEAVNIRGLQPQATLVLLDGRRTPNGGSTGQLYDPSSIPTIALSGIDLLTGGASAIYGSDAVAGVVNFTLRKNFNGFEVSGTYGANIDYHTEKLSAIFGHKWATGSIMIAVEHTHNPMLMQSKRPNLYICNPNGINNCSTSVPTYGNVVFSNSPNYFSVPVTANGTGITQARLTPGAATYDTSQDMALLPKSNRNSVVFSAQQALTSDIRLWAEGYFTQHDNDFIGTLSISGQTVGANNPGFIPLGPGQTSEKAYVNLDDYVGPGFRTGLERAYQAAAGMEVNLPHDWQFNVYGEHNYNYEFTQTQGLNTIATQLALTCASTALCFDPFGPNAVNAAALPQILGNQYPKYWQTEDVVNAKIDGRVFTLPGGDVKLAIGGEYQANSLKVLSLNTIGSPSPSVVRVAADFTTPRTVTSAFGEAVIPIIGEANQLPLVQSFVIDAAGRYDHYSDVGSTLNPKVSFTWRMVSDVSIHGAYGTSFRAPTLCDTNPGCTGTVQSSTTQNAGYDTLTILGGNPDVKPETATTVGLGATYNSSLIKGLSMSLDYYSINYQGVIATPGSGLSASNFNSPLYAAVVNKSPTAAYLQYLMAQPWYVAPTTFTINGTVGSNGLPIAVVNGERFNSGAIITHGLDFKLDYKFSNSLGEWGAGIAGTYLLTFKYSVFKGLPFTEEVNIYQYPTRWRFREKFSWSGHNLSAAAYLNYTGSYLNTAGVNLIPQNISSAPTGSNITPVTKIKASATVDATLIYKFPDSNMLGGVGKGLTLSVSALNLLNTAPPYARLSVASQYDPQNASPLGRQINITLRKAFF